MLGIHLAAFVGVSVVLLGLYTLVQNVITRNLDEQKEMHDGNVAVAMNRGGAYGGMIFAASGSLVMSKADFTEKIAMFALDGVVAMVVFILAHFALDWVVLRGVNNSGALKDGNLAVGITEACAYLSLGLIIGASFSGDGDQSLVQGLLSATAFSFIGLVTLMVIYFVYDIATSVLSRSVDTEITEGNVAASIDAGALLLSMGIVLWFSIAGDFEGWEQDFMSYSSTAVIAVWVMVAARLCMNYVLLRGLPKGDDGEHHNHIPRALLMAGAMIGVSLITGFVTFVS